MSTPALAAKADNVDICHFDMDYGVWKLISISGNAVDMHFTNHDDGLPDGATLGTVTLLDDGCEPADPAEASCVDGIINQGETGFQYKDDQPAQLTGTECGGPNCAPCYDDTYKNQDSSYEACFEEGWSYFCVDGGGGNPNFNSYACTSNFCVCETYNKDLPDSKGYWFDLGTNNISGTQNPLYCDYWQEYCKENEYVDQFSSCVPCPEGTTRRAGDDPLRATTACTPIGP